MDDEIDLLEYWRVIVKRKRLIIVLTLVMAVSALVSSRLQPKMYKATATIMLVDSGGGNLASALSSFSFLGVAGGVAGGGVSQLIPIVKSRALAEQVAKNIDQQKYFPKLYSDNELNIEEKEQSVVGALQGAVEGKVQDLFNLSLVWQNPEHAAELANLYVTQLGKFLNSRSLNINFQMIDPAIAPKSHFKPMVKRSVIIGGFLGLFTGLVWAFFIEFISKSAKKAASPLTALDRS